jgi:hypothetical protein
VNAQDCRPLDESHGRIAGYRGIDDVEYLAFGLDTFFVPISSLSDSFWVDFLVYQSGRHFGWLRLFFRSEYGCRYSVIPDETGRTF